MAVADQDRPQVGHLRGRARASRSSGRAPAGSGGSRPGRRAAAGSSRAARVITTSLPRRMTNPPTPRKRTCTRAGSGGSDVRHQAVGQARGARQQGERRHDPNAGSSPHRSVRRGQVLDLERVRPGGVAAHHHEGAALAGGGLDRARLARRREVGPAVVAAWSSARRRTSRTGRGRRCPSSSPRRASRARRRTARTSFWAPSATDCPLKTFRFATPVGGAAAGVRHEVDGHEGRGRS